MEENQNDDVWVDWLKAVKENRNNENWKLIIGSYFMGGILASYLYSLNWIFIAYIIGFITAITAMVVGARLVSKGTIWITLPILIILGIYFYNSYGGMGFVFLVMLTIVLVMFLSGAGGGSRRRRGSRGSSNNGGCDIDFSDYSSGDTTSNSD